MGNLFGGGSPPDRSGDVFADVQGTWIMESVAKAMKSPGIKMMGSGADFTPKWKLVVDAFGNFTLTCVSGYDFRGRMSSSGEYDGKVSLHEFEATGTSKAPIRSGDVTTWTLSVKSAKKNLTVGETSSFSLQSAEMPFEGDDGASEDEGKVEVIQEARPIGYDVVASLDADGRLSLQSNKLNKGGALQLVRY